MIDDIPIELIGLKKKILMQHVIIVRIGSNMPPSNAWMVAKIRANHTP